MISLTRGTRQVCHNFNLQYTVLPTELDEIHLYFEMRNYSNMSYICHEILARNIVGTTL